MTRARISRFKFLGIVAVFAIPFAIAGYIYQNPEVYDPGESNRGELLDPPRTIKTVSALGSEGSDANALTDDFLTRRWFFLLWNEGGCDLYCEASLFKMQRARTMLGRRASRVQNVYLTSFYVNPHTEKLLQKYPHLQPARLSKERDTAVSDSASRIFSELESGVYIVDPLGNVIMRYDQDAPTRDMVKDMKWLIKASKIG